MLQRGARQRAAAGVPDPDLAVGAGCGDPAAIRAQGEGEGGFGCRPPQRRRLAAGLVEVRGTVIRIKGKGLIIKPKPKSKAGWRTIELPEWTVTILRKRLADAEPNQWDVVFTSPNGLLRDPSNTQADLRAVFDRAGYPEITSHTFRRTVATLMDKAGLSARAAAGQLGHAKVSMTTDNYFGREVRSTGAARVLEALDQPPMRGPDTRNDEENGAEKCG